MYPPPTAPDIFDYPVPPFLAPGFGGTLIAWGWLQGLLNQGLPSGKSDLDWINTWQAGTLV